VLQGSGVGMGDLVLENLQAFLDGPEPPCGAG
jgi:hypothetical protein